MLVNNKVSEFLESTASSDPAPGGGSASALAGALGTALAEMVINLTVGKKKYVEVSEELSRMLPQMSALRNQLQDAVDEDTKAFNKVMAAFGLPKETEEEKTQRKKAIQEATVGATEVPLYVMKTALKALEMALIVARKGNKNSISDAGVANLLLGSAIDGASLNVKINLPGLPEDMPFRRETEKQLIEIETKKVQLQTAIRQAVEENLM